MPVSVVVPARDATATLPALLSALAAQTLPPAQVVVVDDASVDGTADLLAAHPVDVVRGTGAGSYAARNAGLAAVTEDVVAFTDADCAPDPDWLRAAVAALGEHEVLAGRVRQRRREDAGVWERYDRATYLDQRELVAQGYAATANLVTSTALLRGLGGFDERLRSSGDRAMAARYRSAGVTVRFCEEAVVEHAVRTDPRGTWALHRRLGRGWRDLHRLGGAPPWWREPGLRVPLGFVVERVAADGPPLRRRQLLAPHATALAARWAGRLL